jgi:hypothetical protein
MPVEGALKVATDIIKKWVVDSPHYPWDSGDDLDFPEANGDMKKIEKNGQSISLAYVSGDDIQAAGIKHEWVEDNAREWITEVVIAKKDLGSPWVSVKIFCDLLRPGLEMPSPKKPYVVRLLIESQHSLVGLDGPFQVNGKPMVLRENDDVPLAASILSGTVNSNMPIVYVSTGSAGRPHVDVDNLAKWLSGIAHVVVEPSRAFSLALAKESLGVNCYGGAVGIYWPKGNGEHFRIVPWAIRDFPQTENFICLKIRSALLTSGTNKGATWIEIKDILAHKRLEEVRQKGTASLDEYVFAFDETNRALTAKIKALGEHNESLKSILHGYQSASDGESISFLAGEEPEFYNKEISDLLINALAKYKTQVGPGSRAEILINDLLSANKETGEQDKIKGVVKEAFKNAGQLGAREIAALTSLGFDISQEGKHYKAVFCGDSRFTFSFPKTPSDHRSGKNTEHDITKKILL